MKNGYLLLLLLLSILVQAQVVVKKIEPSPNAQSTGSTLQNNSKLRSMSFGLGSSAHTLGFLGVDLSAEMESKQEHLRYIGILGIYQSVLEGGAIYTGIGWRYDEEFLEGKLGFQFMGEMFYNGESNAYGSIVNLVRSVPRTNWLQQEYILGFGAVWVPSYEGVYTHLKLGGLFNFGFQ